MKIHLAFLCAAALAILGCTQSETKEEVSSVSAAESQPSQGIDQFVDVNGMSVRYRAEGPEPGPVLVMIHGFTYSLETWDALVENLKDDFRIFRLDLPGHGLTGPDPQSRYSNDDTVDFVRAFAETLGLSDIVIVGNSLGGLAAWRYAADHPDKTRGLVLIAPGGFSINGVGDDPVPVPAMVQMFLTQAPEAAVRAASQNLYANPERLSDERLTQIIEMMQQPGNGDAFVQRASVFTLPAPEPDLARVSVPTQIIWGQKDAMVPPAHGPLFEAAMPNARLTTFEDSGHVPQEEIPEQVADVIRDFMADIDQ